MTTTNRLLTSRPRNLEDARRMAGYFNNARTGNAPLREIAVVIASATSGYHVATLGFAVANGFEVIR